MAGGRASFEIQSMRDDHWITEEIRDTENAARGIAKTILGKRQCQGVRVIKNWTRADGQVTENVIYTETREAEAPKITIVPIEEAPYCRKTAEYYRLESRTTINRLFRKYVEEVYLTPTELISQLQGSEESSGSRHPVSGRGRSSGDPAGPVGRGGPEGSARRGLSGGRPDDRQSPSRQ